MTIERTLVITNVTSVKDGSYGPRVTISLYESTRPDTSTDTVYMVTLGTSNEILQNMVNQLGINEVMSTKPVNSRVPIPSGIRVTVTCNEESTSTYARNIKYLNKVLSINVDGEVREDVDFTIPARDVIFKDWGIIVQTLDGEYVNDKYLFLTPHVGEKVSGLMDKYKIVTPVDTVRIHGSARLYYSTYPADKNATRWIVKAKSRFDSRFDEPGRVKVEMNINGIKTIYMSKLKRLKGNPAFLQLVKFMGQQWTTRFVGEKEMIGKGKNDGIDLDVNLMASSFLDGDDRDVFYTLKSMLSNDSDVFYHQKGDIKYIIMHDTGTPEYKPSRESDHDKIMIIDLKFKVIYLFTSSKIPVTTFLEKIRVHDDVLFLESSVNGNRNYMLVEKMKIDKGKEWMTKAWVFMSS